jgi:hypothetical protein
MRKTKNPCCLCVAATLATLVLALQPGIVVGDTLATQASSYSTVVFCHFWRQCDTLRPYQTSG